MTSRALLTDLPARLSRIHTDERPGESLAVYVDDRQRREDTIAALREVTERGGFAIGDAARADIIMGRELRVYPDAPPFDLRRSLIADLHTAGEPALAAMVHDGTVPPTAWIRLERSRAWALLSERVREGIREAAGKDGGT